MAGVLDSLPTDLLLRASLATLAAALGYLLAVGVRDRWFRD